ncbi:hypothetical protein GGF50DRAFT_121224 [Schizophyllum commune]
MNIHQAFITPTTILLPQTTEPKLSDAIATLTASPAINVDIIKEDTYSSLVRWVDDNGYRWCNVNGDDCHRCGRAGHIAAFCMYNMPEAIWQKMTARISTRTCVYTIPARRSPSPPASRSPSPPPAADNNNTFDFSSAGGSWGGQYRLFA